MRNALVTMWRFTKNNGITEGFHRKMKLIQRRAYGFRNFHNYRLRVIAQCGLTTTQQIDLIPIVWWRAWRTWRAWKKEVGWVGIEPTTNALKGQSLLW